MRGPWKPIGPKSIYNIYQYKSLSLISPSSIGFCGGRCLGYFS